MDCAHSSENHGDLLWTPVSGFDSTRGMTAATSGSTCTTEWCRAADNIAHRRAAAASMNGRAITRLPSSSNGSDCVGVRDNAGDAAKHRAVDDIASPRAAASVQCYKRRGVLKSCG